MSEGNPIWEHCKEMHNHQNFSIDNFSMKLTGTYDGPLRRQTAEGCFISETIRNRDKGGQQIIVLNSKSQFYQPAIVKLKVTHNDYD